MSSESMPIMKSKYLSSMPMAMLNDAQAMKNHGQSLKRLAERGGLASAEALAIMDGLRWGDVKVCDENDLLLSKRVARFKEQANEQ